MTPEQETEMTYGQESIGSKPFRRSSNGTEPENGECPKAPCSALSARIFDPRPKEDSPVLLGRWQ